MSVGQDIKYRPPLWSQAHTDPPSPEYSAADDRQLIYSLLWPGVIDVDDLKVSPRQEGPNLSVDVAPGRASIHGTDQVEQGGYLCPLAQRDNIPIAAGPAAGNVRTDWIIARVYEPVDDDAYWRVERVPGTPRTPGQPPGFASIPPSMLLLASVNDIAPNTSQITEPMITDWRHLARPGSMGTTLLRQTELGGFAPVPDGWARWGALSVLKIPLSVGGTSSPPIDIEARAEGTMLSTWEGGLSVLEGRIRVTAGERVWESGTISVSSQRTVAPSAFSRTLVVPGVQINWPEQLTAEVLVRSYGIMPDGPYAFANLLFGDLTLRVTPSGVPLSW